MATDTATGALDWSAIENVLPAGWQQLAIDQRLVRPNLPAHMGSKVKDIAPVLRLMLYQVARNTALANATAAFAAGGIIDLSAVALHKWQKKMGGYLSQLVSQMVSQHHSMFAPQCCGGLELLAVDATCVQRPGSKGTTARVHRAMRLTDLAIVEMLITDETVGETFRRFSPEPGQLWIGDRGYANPPGISWVDENGGKVLVRYNRGSLPVYDHNGAAIDVLAQLQTLRTGQYRQWRAFVHPSKSSPIEGRLCAVRLPDDKAKEARERLRREEGPGVSAQSLQMAEFVVVFTTVDENTLTCEQVLVLYRARWQIELDFKRDKSLTGLANLPNFRPDTIRSWICAKLLLNQIVRCFSTPKASIPPCGLEQVEQALRPSVNASAA